MSVCTNPLDVTEHAGLIDYDHRANNHNLTSPRAVLPLLFGARPPASLLDVGCGIGTWMRTARDLGVTDVYGIDGVDVADADLLAPREMFGVVDLTTTWNLGRRYEMALCLEVAEHLPFERGGPLIDALTRHSDLVVFSAACPGQPGQHHVNCQWPSYWQGLFNLRGFVCSDVIRPLIWNRPEIDVWYRQNMFLAKRDEYHAGSEPPLSGLLHPEFLPDFTISYADVAAEQRVRAIEGGTMPLGWYGRTIVSAVSGKIRRRLSGIA